MWLLASCKLGELFKDEKKRHWAVFIQWDLGEDQSLKKKNKFKKVSYHIKISYASVEWTGIQLVYQYSKPEAFLIKSWDRFY